MGTDRVRYLVALQAKLGGLVLVLGHARLCPLVGLHAVVVVWWWWW